MIAIIDYGAGNLGSVAKALDFIGAKNRITDKADEILNADRIIFPGVGNFGDVMKALQKRNLVETLKRVINEKPYLGICLGLQILFEESEESAEKGLGILKGKVVKFKSSSLKIPQIGWNQIGAEKKSALLDGIKDPFVYFVHSYYVAPKEKEIILTTTDYGTKFVSGVQKGNIYGVQFHPEKSGDIGIKMLRNFAEKC